MFVKNGGHAVVCPVFTLCRSDSSFGRFCVLEAKVEVGVLCSRGGGSYFRECCGVVDSG